MIRLLLHAHVPWLDRSRWIFQLGVAGAPRWISQPSSLDLSADLAEHSPHHPELLTSSGKTRAKPGRTLTPPGVESAHSFSTACPQLAHRAGHGHSWPRMWHAEGRGLASTMHGVLGVWPSGSRRRGVSRPGYSGRSPGLLTPLAPAVGHVGVDGRPLPWGGQSAHHLCTPAVCEEDPPLPDTTSSRPPPLIWGSRHER